MEWLIAIAVVSLLVGLGFGIDNSIKQQEQLDIDEERLEMQKQSEFDKALESLDSLKDKFDELKDITIPELEGKIQDTQRDIDLWDDRYALETGKIQMELDTVDDLIGNWQNSYDAQTLSAKAEGQENLSTLLSNWSDAEVMAADRGMGGSMSLVAQQHKQKAIAYAGSDLSLAGNDGIYGAAYATLVANLNSERSMYETKKGLLSGQLGLTQQTLEGELSAWTRNLENYTTSLGIQHENLTGDNGYYKRMEEQLGVIERKYDDLGNKNPNALQKARNLLTEYRQYI